MELSYLALCESEGFSVGLQVEIEPHHGLPQFRRQKSMWMGRAASIKKFHEKLQLKRALQNVSIYAHGISFTAVLLLGGDKKTESREKKINDRNIPIAQ